MHMSTEEEDRRFDSLHFCNDNITSVSVECGSFGEIVCMIEAKIFNEFKVIRLVNVSVYWGCLHSREEIDQKRNLLYWQPLLHHNQMLYSYHT